MMNRFDSRLCKEFQDSNYRRAYVDDFLNVSIASQIKALRDHREWSQVELARRAGMKQSRISTMENVNYGSWSIKTLLKLAAAFDVALMVRFEGFGRYLDDIDNFSIARLQVPSFGDDPAFKTHAFVDTMRAFLVSHQREHSNIGDIIAGTVKSNVPSDWSSSLIGQKERPQAPPRLESLAKAKLESLAKVA